MMYVIFSTSYEDYWCNSRCYRDFAEPTSAFTNHNRVIEDTPGTIIKFLKHKEGTTALVIVEGSIKEVYLESIKLPKEF